MSDGPAERDVVAMWDIARPTWPSRLPGLAMAGFADRGAVPHGLQVVPHPAVTLVLDFADRPVVVEENGRTRRGSLVAGLQPGMIRVRSDHVRCVQVRLPPLMAHAVLGLPAGALDVGAVDLDDVWDEAPRLRAQLHEAASWDARFELVEDALVRRYEERCAADGEAAWAWQRILASRGQVQVGELADETGWSRKRLWSRFRTHVGLTPKRAASLVRFDHAAHRLAAGERPADVAAVAGYADQSHLHRHVQAFAGTTPSALAAAPWLAVDDVAWPG